MRTKSKSTLRTNNHISSAPILLTPPSTDKQTKTHPHYDNVPNLPNFPPPVIRSLPVKVQPPQPPYSRQSARQSVRQSAQPAFIVKSASKNNSRSLSPIAMQKLQQAWEIVQLALTKHKGELQIELVSSDQDIIVSRTKVDLLGTQAFQIMLIDLLEQLQQAGMIPSRVDIYQESQAQGYLHIQGQLEHHLFVPHLHLFLVI